MSKKTAKKTGPARPSKRNRAANGEGTPPPADQRDREVIDFNEAIVMLQTTRPTFYRWMREGKLKGFKVGRKWRFYRDDIERFMRGQEPEFELPADINPLIENLRTRVEELGAQDVAPSDAAPVQHAVSLMIRLAGAIRASDIHLSPHVDEGSLQGVAVLRYRVDGVLQVAAEIDIRLLSPIVEQWKKLAACNVNEKLKPQDGRILVEFNDNQKRLDLRVCFLAANLGEAVTVRILDRDAISLTLENIHYSPRDKKILSERLAAPWGVVLVTGPTGSGKTTALYACVNQVAKPEVKVMSIEDPVEFHLPWVVQTQLRPAAGVTYPVALRSVLRSDPDVVLVGELRDRDSLLIAQQCALTGHLVLTSMHADEAALALVRMVEMGSEPFLVGDATKLVVAQRLVRLLCPHCAKPQKPPAEMLGEAKQLAAAGGLEWSSLKREFRKPVGCPKCTKSGYRGRNVVAEALEVTPEIRAALRQGASVEEIRSIAIEQGMVPLPADGVRRAGEGYTSLEEALRVVAIR